MTYSELSNQLLDNEIDLAHQALAKAEAEALQITERIRKIDGLADYAKRRRSYGEPLNPWRDGSLTAQALILKKDPALASYLARRAGKELPAPDYDEMARKEARDLATTRMAEAAEQLKVRNAKHRDALMRHQTYGRWNGAAGRII
jgi:hypothetical protein